MVLTESVSNGDAYEHRANSAPVNPWRATTNAGRETIKGDN